VGDCELTGCTRGELKELCCHEGWVQNPQVAQLPKHPQDVTLYMPAGVSKGAVPLSPEIGEWAENWTRLQLDWTETDQVPDKTNTDDNVRVGSISCQVP